jgi:prephenate dehydrogenase
VTSYPSHISSKQQPLQVAILGMGLLGSSLAQAIRNRLPSVQITAISSPSSLQKALDYKLVDKGYSYDDIEKWKNQFDLLFLCSPIEHIKAQITALSQCQTAFKEGAVITDIGSTKSEINDLAQQSFKKEVCFVGGHPMAGSEKQGIDGRDEKLFESALWILCPENEEELSKASTLRELILTIGAREMVLDPQTHDQWVAKISHLPQLISTALCSSIRPQQEIVNISGPGFRDMSRLAASPYNVWKDILFSNKKAILNAITDFEKKLADIKSFLLNEDFAKLENTFEEGQDIRQSTPIPLKGHGQGFTYIRVLMQDKAGGLVHLLQPLAKAELDVRDMELVKVREQGGGTFRLAFHNLTEAKRAIQILESKDWKAWISN